MARVLPLMFVLALLCGCGGVSFPELKGVTKAEVRTNRNELVREISDPEQVRRIVAFVNARRSGWETPWQGVPVPKHVVNFYDGEQFVGHFGWGENFFETQRDNRGFFSRDGALDEVQEFRQLVGGDDR